MKKLSEIERDIRDEYYDKWHSGNLKLPPLEIVNKKIVATATLLKTGDNARAFRLAYLVPAAFFIDKTPEEAARELSRISCL